MLRKRRNIMRLGSNLLRWKFMIKFFPSNVKFNFLYLRMNNEFSEVFMMRDWYWYYFFFECLKSYKKFNTKRDFKKTFSLSPNTKTGFELIWELCCVRNLRDDERREILWMKIINANAYIKINLKTLVDSTQTRNFQHFQHSHHITCFRVVLMLMKLIIIIIKICVGVKRLHSAWMYLEN